MESSAKSEFMSYNHQETECPSCHHKIDSATSDSGEGPQDGDYSICFYCSSILRFKKEDDKILLKNATTEDMELLKKEDSDSYDRIYQFQAIVVQKLAEDN